MTKLEASFVEQLSYYNRGAVADIVLSSAEEVGSEGDNKIVDFVRRFIRRDMTSSRSMSKLKKAAKNALLFEDVIGRIAENSMV